MARTILAVVDDMFFASKIRATAEALGVAISFPRTREVLLQKAREARPDLILIDLHHQRFDPVEAAASLKENASVRLGGFLLTRANRISVRSRVSIK
jgi:CheY-like chemotaxis protein